jgi:hypothetical protein
MVLDSVVDIEDTTLASITVVLSIDYDNSGGSRYIFQFVQKIFEGVQHIDMTLENRLGITTLKRRTKTHKDDAF